MKYWFDSDFINQKIYVDFNMDAYQVFKEYLETRTVEELRIIENKLGEEISNEYQQLSFDDYSELIYNNKEVHVFIQYPNDKEKRENIAPLDEFYKLIVRYNHAYDDILIDKTDRVINPKAQAIIDEVYGKHTK